MSENIEGVTGYNAFVGVDAEYRDPNRNASLTQHEVDRLHEAGLMTDAEQHRENQLAFVNEFTAANVVVEEEVEEVEDGEPIEPVEPNGIEPVIIEPPLI